MATSSATTVAKYLKELPADRRSALDQVRKVILGNLNPGFEETMNWGAISYEVPLSTYPETYNKKPLMFAGLASQKQYMAVYLMCSYQDPKLNQMLLDGFKELGKKPNMGKSCVRFKRVEDIPLEVIGKIIKKVTCKKFIQQYEQSRNG